MSIHKSQGQTLQYVKIDLARVFEKGMVSSLKSRVPAYLTLSITGQSYVALSRASSLEGLQVIHFNPFKVSPSRAWKTTCGTLVTLSR